MEGRRGEEGRRRGGRGEEEGRRREEEGGRGEEGRRGRVSICIYPRAKA